MAVTELYEPVIVERVVPKDARIAQLIWWAARFAELGFTPSYGRGDHGNLSCRTPTGLVMTARETEKATLRPDQFVEVIRVEWTARPVKLHCRGTRLPSTDALMHLEVYRLRPDMQTAFHGHDQQALAKAAALRIPVTAHSAATQTLDVVVDVKRLVGSTDYLLLRDHGFLALGTSPDDAGELVRTIALHARSL